MGRQSKLTAAQRAEIADLYQSGLSAEKIAPRYGVTRTTVCTTLARMGINRRPRARQRLDRDPALAQRVHDLAVSGLTARQTAQQLGISHGTIFSSPVLHEQFRAGQKIARHRRIAYHSNCDCDHCRTGKAHYWAARREAIRSGAAEPTHHGVGGYRQGCRCEICRAAVRERRRQERTGLRRAYEDGKKPCPRCLDQGQRQYPDAARGLCQRHYERLRRSGAIPSRWEQRHLAAA